MSEEENRKTKTAALIIIGNEILSGRTMDANTRHIAEKLVSYGIEATEVRILPDIIEIVARHVNELRRNVDYVFTTGGIGPTHDDITTEAVAQAFGVEVVQDPEAYAMLKKHYGEDLTTSRSSMALVPEGAGLIRNFVSGAPGFFMENVYVMAGVPRIMQSMLDYVLDRIKGGVPFLSNAIACDISESSLAKELAVLQNTHLNVNIGSYPHYRGGILGLSIVLRSTDKKALDVITQDVIELIKRKGSEPRAISVRSNGEDLETEETFIG